MRRYQWLVGISIIFISLFAKQTISLADSTTDMIGEAEDDMLENVSLDGIRQYWDKIVHDYGNFISGLEKTNLRDFIKGHESFSLKQAIVGILEYLFHELIINGRLLGTLMLLTLFSAILQTMHTAFEQGMVSKIAYFVVYLVLIFLALNSFYLSVSYAQEAIDTMSSFMIALVPLILGLMATFGQVASVSFFHPLIIFLIHLSSVLVSKFIMPLLFLSALLYIVSSLNENFQVTHLANLFKSVAIGVLGAFLTIFLGVMSVQGAASAVQDGVAMKTAKFITGNFIPVVGRTFTDATDTILSASLLLKNAVGIVGVVIIILIAIFPAIKIFAIAFIYKVAAAVLQPIGGGPLIECLNTISKFITFILACLLTVTLMFFLAIVIIVIASHMTLLLR